ncbi:MAG: iron-sulfur cluster carrier protein ApbC [Pseudomonadota bacterium]
MLTDAVIRDHLADLAVPYLDQTLAEAGALKSVSVDGDRVSVNVALGFPCGGAHAAFIETIAERVRALEGVADVVVAVDTRVQAHAVQRTLKRLESVKNIIAVASGKGGVGKSTTACNLALALAADGAQVGILDADIYGPSQPRMMGVSGRPDSPDGKTIEPKLAHGVQVMSIGFMVDDDTPVVWRGPMVTGALQQLLNETNWQALDYLIVDMPPGTGDLQLTLSQQVPVAGAVIVTTPQDIALLDARKGLKMFEKVEVPVLGVVENMSVHICSACGHKEPIFGEGGGQRMASDYDVRFLGGLPLDIQIREQADGGAPTVVADPDGAIADSYKAISRAMSAALSRRARDFSARFPKIVIENT